MTALIGENHRVTHSNRQVVIEDGGHIKICYTSRQILVIIAWQRSIYARMTTANTTPTTNTRFVLVHDLSLIARIIQ
ncbi:hypothetical protein GCM10009129_00830 [Psychrobacter aestuarii]|uniref:Uncharacterized protein n=1 Tax=Psychrobacter aestuarii TaxID=556327 RepID=A0ABN0VJP1_9GAMM